MRACTLAVISSLSIVLAVRADDAPKVSWRGAGDGHFAKGRSSRIDTIVVHTVEGSQQSAVETFRSGPRKVSAHYVVGDDGSIVQCVTDEDTAFHAKGMNARSIGIEHSGFADRPGTWTRLKYESSARLARSLCDRHGIPIDRAHILGHVEVPGSTHHDPGEHFDWDLYMALIRGDARTDGEGGMVGATRRDGTAPPTSVTPAGAATRSEVASGEAHAAQMGAPAGQARRAPSSGIMGRMGHAASGP